MARVRTAFLANYATQESSGLISAIGAFVDTLSNAVLPIQALVFLVARIEYDESELGHDVAFSIDIVRVDDDEAIAGAHGTMHTERQLGADPNAPAVSQVILPIPVVFERAGRHVFKVTIDDEVVWETPVIAVLLDSAPG